MMAVTYSRFRGKVIGAFRFSHRGEYIGRRAASEGGPGAHTMPWRGQGGPRLIANYGQPKDNIGNTTIGAAKQLKEHPVEPGAKKL
jgi:hypothetical protein